MSSEGSNGISVMIPSNIEQRLRCAVGFFWRTRNEQAVAQGQEGGKDRGSRSAVTGGKQMSGFESLIKELLVLNGVPTSAVVLNKNLQLPGYFRPTKQWDVLVIHRRKLLAVLELKSQVGPSFGNNYNNRVEEAIGSATDVWKAYRENAFPEVPKPWLGYLFMLEDCRKSTTPVSVSEPHFEVFPVFKGASYAERYEVLCRRLVRERLYSKTAFLMSKRDDFEGKSLKQPSPDSTFLPFVQELIFHVKLNLDH